MKCIYVAPPLGIHAVVVPRVRSPKLWGCREAVCVAIGKTVVFVGHAPAPLSASLPCSGFAWQPFMMEFPIDAAVKYRVHAVIPMFQVLL